MIYFHVDFETEMPDGLFDPSDDEPTVSVMAKPESFVEEPKTGAKDHKGSV